MKQIASKAESAPAARLQALRDSLASTGKLYATLQIPDTVAPLEIVCDLAARQVSVSTHIDPPRDSRSRGRVSWLLRQLAKSPPSSSSKRNSRARLHRYRYSTKSRATNLSA